MPLAPGIHHLTPTLPIHVFAAATPGPTALIQAGIHGDEVAGVHALAELLEEGLRPRCGRLLVIPVMNPAAYRARERCAPGGLDLNRCFPGDADDPAVERRLARRFMALVLDERPALMATLHESQRRYDPAALPSFGQTLVYGVSPMPPLVGAVVDQLNAELAESSADVKADVQADERWNPYYYPVATSSTEVIVDAIGCVGICVETWMGFPERRRIAMQRRVVELLLEGIGVGPLLPA